MNLQTNPKRQRRGNRGDRERQQRLRDRRKEQGWRRVSVWLSPEQVDRLERHGGDEWLGRTVKRLLAWADPNTGNDNELDDVTRGVEHATVAVLEPPPMVSDTGPALLSDNGKGRAAFLPPGDKAALMVEVDSLLSQGLSGNDVARKFNNEGRRTVRGSPFVGQILLRDWRKWKATR